MISLGVVFSIVSVALLLDRSNEASGRVQLA